MKIVAAADEIVPLRFLAKNGTEFVKNLTIFLEKTLGTNFVKILTNFKLLEY